MAMVVNMERPARLCDLLRRPLLISGVALDYQSINFAIKSQLIQFDFAALDAEAIVLDKRRQTNLVRVTSLPYRLEPNVSLEHLHSMLYIFPNQNEFDVATKQTCYSYNKFKFTCTADNSDAIVVAIMSRDHLIDHNARLLLDQNSHGFLLNRTNSRQRTLTKVSIKANFEFGNKSRPYVVYKNDHCYLLVDGDIDGVDKVPLPPGNDTCQHDKSEYQAIAGDSALPNGFFSGEYLFLFNTTHVTRLMINFEQNDQVHLLPYRVQSLYNFFDCHDPRKCNLLLLLFLLDLAITGP